MLSPAPSPAFEWRATGTRWRIHHHGTLAPAVAEAAAALTAADEARWSRFREDSEVCAVSRGAGRWVPVSRPTFRLAAACESWRMATGGVFQPLVGAALSGWGYAAGIEEEPMYAEHSPGPAPVTGRIDLDERQGAIRIPLGTSLDLGGIGKGWIAARVGRMLARLVGDEPTLLDAGGDLLAVHGRHTVAVSHATGEGHDAPAPLRAVRLRQGEALATSGTAHRAWRNGDGAAAHHLIDPATGCPTAPAQASVLSGDVVAADVWATVLALRPHRLSTSGLAALITTEDRTEATTGWRAAAIG